MKSVFVGEFPGGVAAEVERREKGGFEEAAKVGVEEVVFRRTVGAVAGAHGGIVEGAGFEANVAQHHHRIAKEEFGGGGIEGAGAIIVAGHETVEPEAEALGGAIPHEGEVIPVAAAEQDFLGVDERGEAVVEFGKGAAVGETRDERGVTVDEGDAEVAATRFAARKGVGDEREFEGDFSVGRITWRGREVFERRKPKRERALRGVVERGREGACVCRLVMCSPVRPAISGKRCGSLIVRPVGSRSGSARASVVVAAEADGPSLASTTVAAAPVSAGWACDEIADIAPTIKRTRHRRAARREEKR